MVFHFCRTSSESGGGLECTLERVAIEGDSLNGAAGSSFAVRASAFVHARNLQKRVRWRLRSRVSRSHSRDSFDVSVLMECETV